VQLSKLLVESDFKVWRKQYLRHKSTWKGKLNKRNGCQFEIISKIILKSTLNAHRNTELPCATYSLINIVCLILNEKAQLIFLVCAISRKEQPRKDHRTCLPKTQIKTRIIYRLNMQFFLTIQTLLSVGVLE
jgi:hypothetical protein